MYNALKKVVLIMPCNAPYKALYNLTNNSNHSQVIKFIVTLRIVNKFSYKYLRQDTMHIMNNYNALEPVITIYTYILKAKC